MTVIGFSFTKMLIERKAALTGQINIGNNISIKNVEEHSIFFGKTKQDGLKFNFEFTSKYQPNIADIMLNGEVIYVNEPKKIKEIIDQWKKDKKISKEVMTEVISSTLDKCNIQALILSRDMNMPPPVPLPKVQADVKK